MTDPLFTSRGCRIHCSIYRFLIVEGHSETQKCGKNVHQDAGAPSGLSIGQVAVAVDGGIWIWRKPYCDAGAFPP